MADAPHKRMKYVWNCFVLKLFSAILEGVSVVSALYRKKVTGLDFTTKDVPSIVKIFEFLLILILFNNINLFYRATHFND